MIKYAVENRRAAATLADLVPKYIAAIPTDPYDGKPFRYRVSAGEYTVTPLASEGIGARSNVNRKILAGQGVLWCVGPDLVDDHGAIEDTDDLNRFVRPKEKTGDIVFIVPSVKELLR